MSGSNYKMQFNGLYADHYTHISPPLDFLYRHTHNEFELLYILSGDVTYVIEDRKYKLKKHDLVVIRPNDYHFIRIDSSVDYQRYDILFSPEILGVDNINLLPENLDVIGCRHRPIISDIFKKIDYYNSIMDPECVRDIIPLLLKELIYNLAQPLDGEIKKSAEHIHPIVAQALSIINNGLFSIKKVGEIADELFVTESYLYRIFQRELKTTPMKYITEKRILSAHNLIMLGKRPTEIYRHCGFEDYACFYRNYIKILGHSPSKGWSDTKKKRLE